VVPIQIKEINLDLKERTTTKESNNSYSASATPVAFR